MSRTTPSAARNGAPAKSPGARSSRGRTEPFPSDRVASLLEQLRKAIPEFVDAPLPKARNLDEPDARRVRADNSAVALSKQITEALESHRRLHRASIRHLLPDREKVQVGGLELVRRVQTSGPSFRVAQFLKKYKLTKAMRPFYSEGTEYEIYDAKELDS